MVAGWPCVVIGLASLLAPVPARIMPPEVAVVVAFPILSVGLGLVFPGSSRIVRAGGGFVGAIALVLLVGYVRGMGIYGGWDDSRLSSSSLPQRRARRQQRRRTRSDRIIGLPRRDAKRKDCSV